MCSLVLLSSVFLSTISCTQCLPLGEHLFPGLISGNHEVASPDISLLEYGPGYSTYGHQQMQVARTRGIKPIVDTITEEEKYGNDGGAGRAVSVAFVSLTEGVSRSVSNNLKPSSQEPVAVLQIVSPFLKNIGLQTAGLA